MEVQPIADLGSLTCPPKPRAKAGHFFAASPLPLGTPSCLPCRSLTKAGHVVKVHARLVTELNFSYFPRFDAAVLRCLLSLEKFPASLPA
jgi:hypothetical protein